MARPKIIRLPYGGEITLKEVKPEDRAKVEKALSATESEEPQTPEVEVKLGSKALGMSKIGNEWCVITLAYDPESQQAQVIQVEAMGPTKYAAEEQFKIQAVKLGII